MINAGRNMKKKMAAWIFCYPVFKPNDRVVIKVEFLFRRMQPYKNKVLLLVVFELVIALVVESLAAQKGTEEIKKYPLFLLRINLAFVWFACACTKCFSSSWWMGIGTLVREVFKLNRIIKTKPQFGKRIDRIRVEI